MRFFFITILLIFSTNINAQKIKEIVSHTAISVGYDYQGRNSLTAGLEYNLPIDSNNWHGYNFGLAVRYFKGKDGHQYFVPEVKLTYRKSGFIFGFQSSTKNFSPIMGVNFMNALHLYSGYSFPFDKTNTNLKGMVFGVRIFISPFGEKFYDKLKIGF
ncbi:hypothetical protein [Capnocytophaga cynodegmi]|uniref:hypothetical protein n=1 Tax=Capnocytophaga cynodegmi TaxID=28189 RepID=UPI00385DA8AC